MKNLSDYTGEEAIELWADIFDEVTAIITDKEVAKVTTGDGASVKDASKVILKKFPKETEKILTRIDDSDLNGANIFPRLATFVTEMIIGDKANTFFKSAEQEVSEEESSGSATENTEGGAK